MPLISRVQKNKSKDRAEKKAYKRWKRSEKAKGEKEEPIWDPERSYVPETEAYKEPERQRWKINGPPITDARKVPKDWDDAEPDLDHDDMDARIKRCEERIQDGILPWIFEDRLIGLKAEAEDRKKLKARYPNVSYEAAQRLETLEIHKEYLHNTNDKVELLSTVNSLIDAYQSGALEWNPGLVTYWSHGKQLCQPRPFNLREFAKVNREHEGWKGFWVEGNRSLSPSRMFMARRKVPQTRFATQLGGKTRIRIPVAMRIPLGIPPFGARSAAPPRRESRVPRRLVGSRWARAGERKDPKPRERNEYPFFLAVSPEDEVVPHDYMQLWLDDDTGADYMQIYEDDLNQLPTSFPRSPGGQTTTRVEAPLMGLQGILQANGSISTHEIRVLEVNILGDDDVRLSFWDWVDVVILPGQADPINPTRICGPWLRHRFYTATCPDAKNRLWINTKFVDFLRVKQISQGRSGPLPSLDYSAFSDEVRTRIMRMARSYYAPQAGRKAVGPRRGNPPRYTGTG